MDQPGAELNTENKEISCLLRLSNRGGSELLLSPADRELL